MDARLCPIKYKILYIIYIYLFIWEQKNNKIKTMKQIGLH